MIMPAKRLGLLGGTFDPIHIGHLVLASHAAESLGLDEVLFIPAQVPPHKLGEAISPSDDRAAMVRAAIAEDERFAFSDLDLQSDTPSYTSELVERLAAQMPGHEHYFITGADSLRDFPTWHKPQTILEHVYLAVAGRPGVEVTNAMLNTVPMLSRRVRLFDSPLIDISSTDIRDRVRTGRCIKYLVPAAVEQYIFEKGVYQLQATERHWRQSDP
jgi:nicotinate-nucleotide adenylyltransferase